MLSAADLRTIGRRIMIHARAKSLGAAAIVVGSDMAFESAVLFEKYAQADRPVRVFRHMTEARDWLRSESEAKSGPASPQHDPDRGAPRR